MSTPTESTPPSNETLSALARLRGELNGAIDGARGAIRGAVSAAESQVAKRRMLTIGALYEQLDEVTADENDDDAMRAAIDAVAAGLDLIER